MALSTASVTTALANWLMKMIATLSRSAEGGIIEVTRWVTYGIMLLSMTLTCTAFFAYDPDNPLRWTASSSDSSPCRPTSSKGVGTPKR